MKKIIKIAIIIFLHSTFCSDKSSNSNLRRGVKTAAAAAAVGAAGAIGLKKLAEKSNLASKVTIQPFNKIFQKLEQNSIKNVAFSGALLAVGLYGTYKIYGYFKSKKPGARKIRKEEEQHGENPVVRVNAEGNKEEIEKPKVENRVTQGIQEEGLNSVSKKEELSQESKSSGTVKEPLGGQTGENPPSNSPATEANEDKKEQNKSAVIKENIEHEKSENVFEAEEEMPYDIIMKHSHSEPKIQETEKKKIVTKSKKVQAHSQSPNDTQKTGEQGK